MQALLSEWLHVFVKYLKALEFRKIGRDIGSKLAQSVSYKLRIERGFLSGYDRLHPHVAIKLLKANLLYCRADITLTHSALCFFSYNDAVGRVKLIEPLGHCCRVTIVILENARNAQPFDFLDLALRLIHLEDLYALGHLS